MPPTTPLAASYARLGEVSAELRISVGDPVGNDTGKGWVTGEQFIHTPWRLHNLVDAELDHAQHRMALRPRRDVAATWIFQHYLWAVAVLLSWPMALDRRVPVLRPGDVALDMPFDGKIAAVTAPTDFFCLSDDPAASHPQARVVADLPELRAVARDVARAHFAPIMTSFAPELRRGPRALWGTATDQLAGCLWYLGLLLGDEPRGAGEAEALLPGGTPPFPTADFRDVPDDQGRICPTRTRVSCCLFYTVRPDQVCATCPRLRDADPALRPAAS